MNVQKDEIALKLINNTAYPQIANILGSVPNLISPNTNTNLYVFDLSTEDYMSLSDISIGISNTSNPTIVNYNVPLLSNDIQGVVQALNSLNMGIFQFYGTSVYVSSGYYIYGALNVNSTSTSFVSLWNTANTSGTTSLSNQIQLPLVSSGTYNFIVDWGDGNTDTITSWNQAETLHTYPSDGNWTITIDGTCIGWSFAGGGDNIKLIIVNSWGSLRLGNTGIYFEGCIYLDLSSVAGVLDLTGTTDLSRCFNGCDSLTTINNINSWDFSNVTNMLATFGNCINFNQNLDSLDVSSVTNMDSTFVNTTVFNGNISSWNVSNVVSMDATFNLATAFNQDISSWDVSNVTIMDGIFDTATSFNQPIGIWNVSSVTSMVDTFNNATAFNQDISSWDVSNVLSMSGFMSNKTNLDYSASFLTSIYNSWGLQAVQPNVIANFGTIKYTGAGASGKLLLTSPPNNWSITDGGI
jgi:surface protein